eukprot:3862744-Amphidinium_carterae.1
MTICAVDRENPELPQRACLNNLYEEADAFEDEEGLALTDLWGSTGEGRDLSDRERAELESHSVGNHWPKCSNSPTCVVSDGPVKRHMSKQEKSPHVIHADLGGPYELSRDGFRYILVLALRLVGLPLLIFGVCLCTKGAAEVKQAMETQLAFIERLSHPNLPPVGQKRVLRIQTDRSLEFCNGMFEGLCREQAVHHSVTVGYDPQSNGSAERSVSICKGLVRRLLMESGLKDAFWSYVFRHSTTALLLQALCDTDYRLPPFGASVAARQLRVEKGSLGDSRSFKS